MSNKLDESWSNRIKHRLQTVFRGEDDTRLRATWRILLALPVFIIAQMLSGQVTMALGLDDHPFMAGLAVNYIVLAGIFAIVFAGWARFIDRRAIADYGFAPSGRWLADSLAGVAAVAFGTAAWHGLGAALGWTTLEPTLAYSEGSLALWLGILFVTIYLSAWVQDVVYFGFILRNTAEGLFARGLSAIRALAAAIAVTVFVFAGFHFAMEAGAAQRLSPPAAALMLTTFAGLGGLLYIQTGELALPIGVHTGGNFVFGMLFVEQQLPAPSPEVVRVSNSFPEGLSIIGAAQVPELVVTYLLALAWIRWRHGDASVEDALARWVPTDGSPV